MSFNNDLKHSLLSADIGSACCKNAYDAGVENRQFDAKCKNCDAHFLRGIFVKNGYMSDPDKRCELVLRFSDDFVFYVQGVLREQGMDMKISLRKGKPILYCKRREGTEDFFTFIGAGKMVLTLIQSSVMLDLRKDANRRNNSETANIDRSARACAEQITAINYLLNQHQLQILPAELKEAAEIRLEHPEDSLEELRKYFSSPISKSGIRHRFVRLCEIAETHKYTGHI